MRRDHKDTAGDRRPDVVEDRVDEVGRAMMLLLAQRDFVVKAGTMNNLLERQFGISPKDRSALNIVLAVLKRAHVVRMAKAA